ncbi:MAG TPA: phospholipase C, phosphocholine-specific [Dyella sp.]|uniref:phosphocholine-specific phospholipase C n=1 Tax=Dyella sp. TaxID=1869338 RepID=UPI002F94AEE9
MNRIDDPARRRFLKIGAASAGSLAAMCALPPVIRQTLATPAARETGDITDVQHVVIFMQENRSFDHYFGSLAGVRGFADRVPAPLPGGQDKVWRQPDASQAGYMLPFRIDTAHTSGMCMHAPAMSYPVDTAIWNGGRFDAWNTAREPGLGMGYFTRDDLPFYYALADAFTLCDQYFCSTLTQTNPNRLHFFSGTNGLSVGRDAALDNTEPSEGFEWATYAERLQEAGISWKVYQQSNNFDDNALAWFANFKRATPGQPLYERGMVTVPDLVAAFAKDVADDTLPQVSWIVAPDYLSEHANYKPAYGEHLTAQLLGALVARPDVYAKTVFILNYDENGGFFDHVPPPTPPASVAEGLSTASTDGEIVDGKPIGLGFRVPLMAISPWSRGGWVCSQVFDHTSVLRFLEARFGVVEPNISPWRRAVCGDLTSVFDFTAGDTAWPSLPETNGYPAEADAQCSNLPEPTVPLAPSMPSPESNRRRLARALPYELDIQGSLDTAGRQYRLRFANTGGAGAVFQVYAAHRDDGPRRYTVEAGKTLADDWSSESAYQLEAHGPNGFLRVWNGHIATADAMPETSLAYDPANRRVHLTMHNEGSRACTFTVKNGYTDEDVRMYSVPARGTETDSWDLRDLANWYDLSVTVAEADRWLRRLAGHMEDGVASLSEPSRDDRRAAGRIKE